MQINLRGHDVRHVLGVEFGELDPGIELRDEGFFVPNMDDVPDFALDDVEVLLDGHSSGQCLLELPATVDAFLDFAEGYPAIKDRIDPRKLIRRIEQAAWVQARSDATEEGKFQWTAISQVITLRRDLQSKHDLTENDSRKVALREVLDTLDKILPDPESTFIQSGANNLWPWGGYTNRKLDLLAAAVKKFWPNPETENPPKNLEVEQWLQSEGGISKQLAETVATVIRPDAQAVGRPARKGEKG